MKKITFFVVLIIFGSGLVGCPKGSPVYLVVDQILGSVYVYENESEVYSIAAYGASGITYLWAIEPSDAGTFTGQGTSSIHYFAPDVEEDTQVGILVTVSADNGENEFRRTDITVRDGAGDGLNVGNIQGQSFVQEFETVQYSVVASGDTGIVYMWEVDPAGAGTWESETESVGTFTAGGVDELTNATIKVTVDSDNYDPVEREMGIGVMKAGSGWAQTWGGSDEQYVAETVLDPEGNIVAAGYFVGSIDLDPGDGQALFSSPERAMHLSWFDVTGSFLRAQVWISSGTIYPCDIFITDNGEIYICGTFSGTVDFDTGSGIEEASASGFRDAFLMCILPDGTLKWAHTWGGTEQTRTANVLFNDSGITVTGDFWKETDFDPGPGDFYRTSTGFSFDLYFSRFDLDGNWKWTKVFGSDEGDFTYGAIVDTNNNLYITGVINGAADFDPDIFNVEARISMGSCDAFLASYTSDGDFRWVNTWGSVNYENANNVHLFSSGILYVVGDINGSADFDPDPLVDDILTGSDHSGSYLTSYTTDGNYLQAWTWCDGSSTDNCRTVNESHDGNLIIGGRFWGGTTDLDPASGEYLVPGDASPFTTYLAKYDLNLDPIWINIQPAGFAMDHSLILPDGSIIATGRFGNTVDFDPTDAVDERTAVYSEYYVFLMKYLPDGTW